MIILGREVEEEEFNSFEDFKEFAEEQIKDLEQEVLEKGLIEKEEGTFTDDNPTEVLRGVYNFSIENPELPEEYEDRALQSSILYSKAELEGMLNNPFEEPQDLLEFAGMLGMKMSLENAEEGLEVYEEGVIRYSDLYTGIISQRAELDRQEERQQYIMEMLQNAEETEKEFIGEVDDGEEFIH